MEKRRNGWNPGFTALGLPKNPAPAGPSLTVPASNADEQSTRLKTSRGTLSVALQSGSRCPGVEAAKPGDSVQLRGIGFVPFATVLVSTQIGINTVEIPMGETQADSTGAIAVTLPLPTAPFDNSLLVLSAKGPADEVSETLILDAFLVAVAAAPMDSDSDGVVDPCDNCLGTFNMEQADFDNDGIGDACDLCPEDSENDLDRDGVCAPEDPCPLDAKNDEDGDGICADQDGCPWVYDPEQQDEFYDGYNDACSQICGSPSKHVATPAASDCLFILRTAVGAATCTPECICDTNGDKSVKASDALSCLRKAVGQAVTLSCGC